MIPGIDIGIRIKLKIILFYLSYIELLACLMYNTKYIINNSKKVKGLIMKRQYNFINDDICIDFQVTKNIRDAMMEAEQADADNNYSLYYNACDFIDIAAKECVVNHVLTKQQWDALITRYCC